MAACYFARESKLEELAVKTRSDPNRWREVALLSGPERGKYGRWTLADFLCYRDVGRPDCDEADAWGGLLAGQLLNEFPDGLEEHYPYHRRIIDAVRDWLVFIIEKSRLPALERARAGDILAQFPAQKDKPCTGGDPRPGVEVDPNTGLPDIELIKIPPGKFLMGTKEEDIPRLMEQFEGDRTVYEHEIPQHEVELPAYKIAKYPVTNAQYQVFVDRGGYKKREYWPEAEAAGYWKQGKFNGRTSPWGWRGRSNLINHPVFGVSWYEALAFCRWLTEEWRKGQG